MPTALRCSHVGIYGPFRMMLGDATWRSYRAAIVPPGLRHALDVAGGVHGKLFVETDSPSASAFRCRFPYRRGAVTDLNDPEVLEIFRWIFEDDPQQEAVERRLDLLLAPGSEKTHLDPRIQKVAFDTIYGQHVCRSLLRDDHCLIEFSLAGAAATFRVGVTARVINQNGAH